MNDDETLTAYHEAGHAVIGYALGGSIDGMQLGGEEDDWLPARFGDCRINWGRVDANSDWQRKREILTILAGPVAEMVYRDEPLHPAAYGPWKDDWERAWSTAEVIAADPKRRTRLLEQLIRELHSSIKADTCWAAIAALADELLAHEALEAEQVAEVLQFWVR
ncbi:MAG: cell division protein FtsH [Rubripirellula sp.]